MRNVIVPILILSFLITVQKSYSQANQNQVAAYTGLFSSIEAPSYVIPGPGKSNLGPMLYEANISPVFYISPIKLPNWGFVFTPQILIRMYDQYSHPVRTPSYMPRGTIFFHIENPKYQNDQFISLTLGHHSNGQDGLLYQSDSVTINTTDGSFATNYISVGYELFTHSSHNLNPFDGIRLSAELHSIHDTEVRNLYGRLRFNADLKSRYEFNHEVRNIISDTKVKPEITGLLHLGWIALDMNNTKPFDINRLIFSYTLSYQPAIISNIEVFVRYYHGQDYYNINFNRMLSALQFGFSIRDFSLR